MSTARSATISASVTVTLIWGTNSPRDPTPIEASTSTAYTNVATNVPRVIWVPRSRMKLRSIRGPNWVEVSVSATITIEKTTPITVMTAAAMADSPARNREDALVRSPVECVGDDEQDHRGHDLERGHKPEVGPQHIPAPIG